MLGTANWATTDVRELIPGIDKLAALSGKPFPEDLTQDYIQELFKLWGKSKVFKENAPAIAETLGRGGQAASDEILNLINRSGFLDSFGPRFVTGTRPERPPQTVIVTGGTASWIVRRVAELHRTNIDLGKSSVVYMLASSRVCDGDTETVRPDLQAMRDQLERWPTEHEWLERQLESYDIDAWSHRYDGGLSDLVQLLLEDHPEIADGTVYVPTNANAANVPLQVRRAIREVCPGFDSYYDQLFFSQDGVQLARTVAQVGDPVNFQDPLTVFSGLARFLNEHNKLQAA